MSTSTSDGDQDRVTGARGARPAIAGAITFFYYDDLRVAARWYAEVIGLEPVLEEAWLVLLRVAPGHLLGLVDAEGGSQRPVPGPNKGAVLSLETDSLEEWRHRLRAAGVEGLDGEFQSGCQGRTLEFRVRDPGGYPVEFFRWRTPLA